MVTVVRDGRCEEMEPVCTGLLHHADLPTRGFSATVVKDFNGAGWERFIAWRKGDWVVVTDRLRAAKPGRFGFDCVWKCIDQGAEEIVEGRSLRIARGQGLSAGHVLLNRVADPQAKRKEAFVFLAPSSQFQTLVDLPAGEYKTAVYARGVDTSADSLWVTVDWDEPVAHHIPIGAIGPSSMSHTKDAPSPVIKVAKSGEHLLTITLRENPGVVLDRIVFEPVAGGAPVEVIAVQSPPAPPRPNPNVRTFHVVNADAATLSLVRRLGSSGPIKLLFQRQSATLRAAETVTFRNLLYLDKRGEQKAYDLRPLGAQGAVLLADGRRIISCDGLDAGGLTSDAALAEIGPDCVCLVDAARLAGKQELFTASRPASVEVNLKTGTATVVAAADVEVGFAGGAKLKLSAGRQEVKLTAPEVLRQDVQRALESVGTPALPKAAQPHGEQAGGAPRELWRLDAKPMTDVADIASADVDGDGRAEAFVCAGRDLICLDAEGKERWRFNCKWPVLCVCVADANGDKKPEVLCGGRDKSFHVLDANGRLLVEHEMTEPLVIGQGGTRDPFVRCLAAADVNGDGSVEIVVGCTNSNISAFRGSDLTRLWTRSGIYHGAARIALTDLDGDGKLEVLVSDHYGSVHIISHDGRQETRVYSELGDVFFDSGDLDGDGKQEVLNGSGTGAFVASAYPGKPLWSFNNYGYAARTVLARDLDGDGKAEAIVGLDSGYLFALGGDGKPKWQLEVGAAILSLVYTQVQADQPSVLVAGLRDGSLLVVGRKGEILMRAAQPSPITKVHIVPEDLGKARRLLVLDESNVVRLLGFPH